MINPETLDLSSLPSIPLTSRSDLPTQSAIYFAINSLGIIQYIGRTANLRQRWQSHHRFNQLSAMGEVRIAYLFLDADLLPNVEEALIAWFKPCLNGVEVSQECKSRQRTYTPRVPDKHFDEMINLLKNGWGYDKDSDLIHHLVTTAYNEMMARRLKNYEKHRKENPIL